MKQSGWIEVLDALLWKLLQLFRCIEGNLCVQPAADLGKSWGKLSKSHGARSQATLLDPIIFDGPRHGVPITNGPGQTWSFCGNYVMKSASFWVIHFDPSLSIVSRARFYGKQDRPNSYYVLHCQVWKPERERRFSSPGRDVRTFHPPLEAQWWGQKCQLLTGKWSE